MPQARLDRRITIQSATEARDAHGEPLPTWSDLAADEPAEFLPLSGSESFQAGQDLARVFARFRIRHRTDLTHKMRIVFDGQNWNVDHFQEDRRFDRRQYLLITAELVAAT